VEDSHQPESEVRPAANADGQPQVPQYGDLVLRTPPNWTAVIFLGMLGGLHLSIAVPSLLQGRYGYLSLIVGTIFVVVSLVGYRCRFEMTLLNSQRRLRLRTGMGRLCYERFVPFSSVRAVRLMVEPGLTRHQTESLIELLCRGEDIPCPPTTIPRQQALFMAMAMNVPLIRVWEGSEPEAAPPDRAVDANLSGRLGD
jgi:hypothetical protein